MLAIVPTIITVVATIITPTLTNNMDKHLPQLIITSKITLKDGKWVNEVLGRARVRWATVMSCGTRAGKTVQCYGE